MPTKDELIDRIAEDLARKDIGELVWADVTAAFGASTANQRAQLIEGIQRGSQQRIGEVVLRVVRIHLKTQAETEATSILADDSMSLTEFNRWLDPPTPSV